MAAKKTRRDIYQEITDRILEILAQGVVPWKNPIRGRSGGDGWPKNLSTGKRYRGINVFMLAFMSWNAGFSSDYWLTFNQAKALGGSIKKGEKSSLVTFWKLYEKQDKESGEATTLPCLRHYNVFSVEQCEGLKVPDVEAFEPIEFTPIEAAEQLMAGFQNPPKIEHQSGKAAYRPSIDTIVIAPPEQFESVESYYSTLFHEAVHSTMHETRLKRGGDAPQPFGSADYSREELIAECGASFLSGMAGIVDETIDQSASYIEHWIKALQGDKRLMVNAASAGQKAADHILGTTFESEPS